MTFITERAAVLAFGVLISVGTPPNKSNWVSSGEGIFRAVLVILDTLLGWHNYNGQGAFATASLRTESDLAVPMRRRDFGFAALRIKYPLPGRENNVI